MIRWSCSASAMTVSERGEDMRTIENTALYLRSKNAGPFWLTIDAFCRNEEDTVCIAKAFEREKEYIAGLFHVKPEDVQVYCLKDINVAKVSVPRVPVEGSRNEMDMHGGQQYVSLLDIEC